ncbi:hypothetical protein AF70_00003370 [Pseudomonas sp. KD5]|nr:hypothetical protein [Pseudomonas sp. KD5]
MRLWFKLGRSNQVVTKSPRHRVSVDQAFCANGRNRNIAAMIRLWRILLHQMPGIRNGMKLRPRNHLMQRPPALNRNPLIVFPPENLHRAANRRVQRFDLAGITLIHLRDLPIERRLPRITQPGLHVRRQLLIGNLALDRTTNIGRHNRPLNVIRQPAERRFMLTHMLHERRTPGRQRHRVNQRQAAVILAIEQMRAQHSGAAEIVSHHVWPFQAPVFQQLRQQLVLHAQGHIAVRLCGLPVTQQIEVMHPVRGDEVRRDPVPHMRREGRAVHEHQRRTVTTYGVANGVPVETIGLSQRPVSHGCVLLACASPKA